jgi:pyrroloquinoline-quinone synthase
VRNRYYYQTRIPLKDGLILGKAPDAEFRRGWVRRIHDHDGRAPGEGGLELWLRLADAVGCDRAEVASLRRVLPGVRRACDDYVAFVASHDLLDSVAASLTELRAGPLLGARADAFEKHYAWVAPEGLAYFRSRTVQAPRDAEEGLAFVLARAASAADQERCVAALARKCEILWSLLDGVEWGGRRPRLAAAAKLRREGDGAVVVLPERALRVDARGRAILDASDGERCADDVAAALGLAYPDDPGVAADVFAFLERMEALGALEMA